VSTRKNLKNSISTEYIDKWSTTDCLRFIEAQAINRDFSRHLNDYTYGAMTPQWLGKSRGGQFRFKIKQDGRNTETAITSNASGFAVSL
jgi:hypothetical protein